LAGQGQARQPQLGQRIRILTDKGICFPQTPDLAQAKVPHLNFSLPGVCNRLRLRDGTQLDRFRTRGSLRIASGKCKLTSQSLYLLQPKVRGRNSVPKLISGQLDVEHLDVDVGEPAFTSA
jgi:hypothetical protein